MRVLVCGGRNFTDEALLWVALNRLHQKHGFMLVIIGDVRGAGRLAGE